MLLRKGITLVEFLTVLGIISILATISYPQYRRYIRRGRQLEAKANLGVVYQKQLSYLSSELEFSRSLKTIGAVPRGRIRYNIGTEWHGDGDEQSLNQDNDSTDLCRCHNDEKGTNIPTYSCWADPNPEISTDDCSDSKKCYGNSNEDITVQLGAPLNSSIASQPGGKFDVSSGKFEYYAIGCTSPSFSDPNGGQGLDVWSINHKKSLKNIRAGF